MKKVLYLSYDGMTDPLGQSQVINYLIGLSNEGLQFDIISFEKPAKFQALGSEIKALLDKNNIGWYPQVFHQQIPVLSKVQDRRKMYTTAVKLHKRNKYDVIHCRCYIAAEIGLKLKRATGVKFFFDIRCFWANQKQDDGRWDTSKWFWKKVFDHYKKKEKEFVQKADHMVCLTAVGKSEIKSWPFYTNIPLTVIPCCANSDLFDLTSPDKKKSAREALKIPADAFVLSYLGSLGTLYMLEEMIQFFKLLLQKKSNAFFLIITNSEPDEVKSLLALQGIETDKYMILSVPFTRVPQMMHASDLSLSLTKPVYSKMAGSPVKIGEILSMGIPMIANNVGDSGLFIQKNKLGIMLPDTTEKSFKNAIDNISTIINLEAEKIRQVALEEYSLENGVNAYREAYEEIFS